MGKGIGYVYLMVILVAFTCIVAINAIAEGESCIDDLDGCDERLVCMADTMMNQQTAKCRTQCDIVADIVIIMDNSGSLKSSGYELEKAFVLGLISAFTISTTDVQLGIVNFEGNVIFSQAHTFGLTQHTSNSALHNAVLGFNFQGGATNTSAALLQAKTILSTAANRPAANDYVIVITDGKSNRDSANTIPSATLLKNTGALVYAVGVGNYDITELNGISSDPDSQYVYTTPSFQTLDSITTALLKDICVVECDIVADIVIIMDNSGSVKSSGYELEKAFVLGLISALTISPTDVQLGIVNFEGNVIFSQAHTFGLTQHTSNSALLNAVLGFSFHGGATKTSAALLQAKTILSTAANRPAANDYVIMITDGKSNRDSANTIPSATLLKNTGALVYAVGVGNYDITELNGISSDPDSQYVYTTTSFQTLDSITTALLRDICGFRRKRRSENKYGYRS